MTLVVDSSCALAYCFEDERTPSIISIFERILADGAIAPPLWRYEIANGLLVAQRRGRITAVFRSEILTLLANVPIRFDDAAEAAIWAATVELADATGLTVYDAAYLEIALRRRLPLATQDRALARAAKAMDVTVID